MKKRVLIVTGSYPPMWCGVGDYTRALVAALSGFRNIELGVLTSKDAAASPPPANVTFLPVVDSWGWPHAYRIIRAIRAWKPSIVHVQLPTLGYASSYLPWFLPLILRWLAYEVVQTWHVNLPGSSNRTLGWSLRLMGAGLATTKLIVVYQEHAATAGPFWRWVYRNKQVSFLQTGAAIPPVALHDVERNLIRQKYCHGPTRMIVFFGFLYASKRVELLFEIADPERCSIVIVGGSLQKDYAQRLETIASQPKWRDRATLTGFLSPMEVSRIVAAADAAVLPYSGGAREWNSALQGAQAQGTFVLTTAYWRRGYDAELNTYYADVDDIDEMRQALVTYMGRKVAGAAISGRIWDYIAFAHAAIYLDRHAPE